MAARLADVSKAGRQFGCSLITLGGEQFKCCCSLWLRRESVQQDVVVGHELRRGGPQKLQQRMSSVIFNNKLQWLRYFDVKAAVGEHLQHLDGQGCDVTRFAARARAALVAQREKGAAARVEAPDQA